MPFLLERLSVYPGSQGRAVSGVDEEAAILAQIQRILSTRRRGDEFVAAVPWGTQTVVEIGVMASVQLEQYAREVKQAILVHEPRLQGVDVKLEPTGESLMPYRLLISGIFPGEVQARSVSLALPY